MSADSSHASTVELLHPIACVPCRKNHKKCDRTKPVCGKCKKRGIPCEYRDPGKRGRLSKISGSKKEDSEQNHFHTVTETHQFQPYLNIISECEQQKHLDRNKVFDLFYNIFHVGSGVIEKKEFEMLLDTKDHPDRKPAKILYLAIKALGEQRLGMQELAEDTMKQARTMLTKFFDQHSNFLVVCAFAILSLYESGCGRLRTAKYYLKPVEFYFGEMTTEEAASLTLQQRNLKKVQILARVWIGNSDHLAMLKVYSEMVESHGMTVSQEYKDILAQDVGPNNYYSIMKAVDVMFEKVRNYLGEKPQLKATSQVIDIMVICGFRIAILKHVGKGRDVIEDCALRITNMTQHEYFSILPSCIVSHVILAARVHLDIVKTIERGERENPVLAVSQSDHKQIAPELTFLDYYDILAKDFRALTSLAARFKKVNLFHRDLLTEIEEVLHQRLELQLGANLDFSLPPQDADFGVGMNFKDEDAFLFDSLFGSEYLMNYWEEMD